MKLSEQAIKDLRKVLATDMGECISFTDEELNEIGMFVLASIVERLKVKRK